MATFGNTDIETANEGSNGKIIGLKFTAPSGGGDITKMSFYTRMQAGGPTAFGAAIYSDNAGSPDALLAQDSGNATVAASPAAATWYDINIAYTFSSLQVLWLFIWSGDDTNMAYFFDTDAGTNFAFLTTGTFESWPNPMTEDGTLGRIFSLYATYTPAGGGATLMGAAVM